MERILIIDDEKEIVNLMVKSLTEAGYKVSTAFNGLDGLEILSQKDISLVILDIMMPGMNGLEVCEIIRNENNVPIIMVSAKGQQEDKIKGLLQGADDYIVKPFSMEELIARVISQIRRFTYFNGGMKEHDQIVIKGIEIDEKQHKVKLYGNDIKLTKTEYEILLLLAKNPGIVFSSEEIYKKLWEEKYFEGNNTVMAHMWRLREKIEVDPKNPTIIET
jgi:DNA-binding response OmpR family regulator